MKFKIKKGVILLMAMAIFLVLITASIAIATTYSMQRNSSYAVLPHANYNRTYTFPYGLDIDGANLDVEESVAINKNLTVTDRITTDELVALNLESNVDGTGYNVTLDWIFAMINWSDVQNKFITAVDEVYINMVGTTAIFNDTKNNETIDSRVTTFNDSMKTYVDARDVVDNLHKHAAENITSGTFGSGDFIFEDNVTIADTLTIGNSSSAILNTPTNTYLRVGDTGTTSHSLTANDDLLISGKLEVNGLSHFDSQSVHYAALTIYENVVLALGTVISTDASIEGDAAHIQTLFNVGSRVGRSLVIGDSGNVDCDYDHSLQPDPTLFLHSITDPDDDNTEWGSFAYVNVTDTFDIKTGKGDLNLNPAGNINASDHNITSVDCICFNNNGCICAAP